MAAASVGGGCGMISVQPMAFIYELLYRIGFVPWDSDSVPDELQTLVEGRAALSPGRALDLGCGTGTNAVYLATRGWQVTAIDNVERALRRARDRAAARGVAVNWLNGDVSRLADVSLAPGFALVLDRGCYHGLGGRQRDAYAAAVTDLARPGATFLMWAMAPNRRPFEPAGADAAEIEARFRGWEPSHSNENAAPASVGAPAPGWHRLTRR